MSISLDCINFTGLNKSHAANKAGYKNLNSNSYPSFGCLDKDTISFSNPVSTLDFDEKETRTSENVPKNVQEYLGCDLKHLDKAKEILNDAVFEFKLDGEKFEGTLQEYFEHCIINPKGYLPRCEIYHGISKENIDSMLSEGLDYTKTVREKCGPGTYFTGGMGSIFSYGGAMLKGEYCGKQETMPVFSPNFYTAVVNHPEIGRVLKDEIGPCNAGRLLKVCAHDILTDNMGIDILYASGGRSEGCFVVLNDDCMHLSK